MGGATDIADAALTEARERIDGDQDSRSATTGDTDLRQTALGRRGEGQRADRAAAGRGAGPAEARGSVPYGCQENVRW